MTNRKLSPVIWLTTASVLLLAVFGTLWWRNVYSDPQRVFEAMLSNSLRINSVTKITEENDTAQSSRQIMQLQFGPADRVGGQTYLEQGSADNKAIVQTENIGTPTADYVRYTNIETDQTGAGGQAFDFSSILNVWGKTESGSEGQSLTSGQLYSETVLGIIPFGVPDQAAREELLELIDTQNVYQVDYANVSKSQEDGRPRYTYQVAVDGQAYITMLRRFGELHGLNHLSALDPAAYAGQQRVNFSVTVDVWSRQLKRIIFEGGQRIETYQGHNGRYDITLPAETISIDELQTRLQEVQQ